MKIENFTFVNFLARRMNFFSLHFRSLQWEAKFEILKYVKFLRDSLSVMKSFTEKTLIKENDKDK